MNTEIKNGDVVNNSNHLQRELDLINNEYQIIETESMEKLKKYNEQLLDLRNKKRKLIKDCSSIRIGDRITTLKKYPYYSWEQNGKTNRSMKQRELYTDFVYGEIEYIYFLEDKKVFRYGYKMDWKENITTGLSKELSSRDYLDEDGFNKFFQVIKN
jgi:hypothetical protein